MERHLPPLLINLFKKLILNATIKLNYKKACALLVQLVERRSPKPNVGGSSPPGRAQK